jgi:hypothetical protein
LRGKPGEHEHRLAFEHAARGQRPVAMGLDQRAEGGVQGVGKLQQ